MKKSVLSQCAVCLVLMMLFASTSHAQNSSRIPPTLSGKTREYYAGAIQGDVFSMVALAVCYQNGDGAPQDYDMARDWYQRAADKGNVIAQYNLANIYDEGVGVPQNFDLAAFWYEKAAMQGEDEFYHSQASW